MEELTFQIPEGEALAGLNGIVLELELITLWVRSDPEAPIFGRYRVDIQLPNGDVKEAAAATLDIDLQSFQRVRSRVGIGALPYAGVGRYEFLVKRESGEDWEIVGQVPFDLRSLAESETQTSAG